MVTFFHDHIFLKCKNQYYTSGSLNSGVLKRYIAPFGKIRLVTRQKEVEFVKADIRPSSVANTEFVEVPNYKSFGGIFNYIKARRIIRKEVAEAEYIIIRTGSVANIAAKYAKKYKKPYLVEVVGCAWDGHWNYNLVGKILAPFSYLMQKRTVRDADYAVYVTNEYLQKKYPNANRNISCSNVDLVESSEEVLRNRIEKIKALGPTDKIVLGTTAALDVKYKGQQYVIQALGELKKRGMTNFEYQLVGGGDKTYLESVAKKFHVSKQVKFIGSLPHAQVFSWLDSIDIYIQPSRQEGLPRALIEAMSRGLPSIGAKTAGIPELLDQSWIFSNSSQNIEEICRILLTCSTDKLVCQAKRNFKESNKYAKTLLDEKRAVFFNEYKVYVDSKKRV